MAGYVDGEKAARIKGISGEYAERDGNFHIGGRPGSSFSGAVDDFAIFNTTLSEDDIKMIVERGLARAALSGVSSTAKLLRFGVDLRRHHSRRQKENQWN